MLVYLDLTQGRDPLAALRPRPARCRQGTPPASPPPADSPPATRTQPTTAATAATEPAARQRACHNAGTGDDGRAGGHHSTDAGDGDDDASWDGCPDMPEWQHERRGTTEDDDHHDGPGVPAGPPAPFPAMINLTVPAGTAYGWSSAPGEAGGWGLLDPGDTRRLLQAASLHPRTRWRVTLLAPDGTAAAHGRARGPHPWIPPPDSGTARPDPTPGRPPRSPNSCAR